MNRSRYTCTPACLLRDFDHLWIGIDGPEPQGVTRGDAHSVARPRRQPRDCRRRGAGEWGVLPGTYMGRKGRIGRGWLPKIHVGERVTQVTTLTAGT